MAYYKITIEDSQGFSSLVLIDKNITEVSHTFDQNGNVVIAYVAGGDAKLYWYDPTAADYVTDNFGADMNNPRVTLDDKRDFASSYSDIIFAYKRADQLCYRVQRERYATEHVLLPSVGGELYTVQMGSNLRLQFLLGRGQPNILQQEFNDYSGLGIFYAGVEVKPAPGVMDDEYAGLVIAYAGMNIGDISKTLGDEYAGLGISYRGIKLYDGKYSPRDEYAGLGVSYAGVSTVPGFALTLDDEYTGLGISYTGLEIA